MYVYIYILLCAGAKFYAKQARQYDSNGDEDFDAAQMQKLKRLNLPHVKEAVVLECSSHPNLSLEKREGKEDSTCHNPNASKNFCYTLQGKHLEAIYACTDIDCDFSVCIGCKNNATEKGYEEFPYFRHWKTQNDYENLPLTRKPFQKFELRNVKRTTILGTSLSTEVKGLRQVGSIRANVYATKIPGLIT